MMSLDKLPGVAEVAMQTGHYAGRKVTLESIGETLDKPFRYRDLGSAAYVCRGRTVVSTRKMHFGGFIGWVAWLFVHIGFLTCWPTASARCSAGGTPSPATCAVNAASPSMTCRSASTAAKLALRPAARRPRPADTRSG